MDAQLISLFVMLLICVSASNGQNERCILLIGGEYLEADAAPVEYYHPTEGVECDVGAIGKMSTERVRDETEWTSGCYLSATQRIVIREGSEPPKPPMLYGLKDGSAKQLPLPHNNKYTYATYAALVGPSKCVSCGGDAGGGRIAECYQFDPSLDESKWTPITPMPYASTYVALVSLTENDLYLTGGYLKEREVEGDEGGFLDKLHRYNVADGTWTEETPMLTKRWRHVAAPLSKTEFIICGGSSPGVRTEYTCDIYDTTQKKWRATGSMIDERAGFALLTFGGDLYAVGGYDEQFNEMNTVEKYDRATGEWKKAKPMNHERAYFVGVVV